MSFKSLACAVSVQCQEIKQALASISYFDTWEADVVAECCRVSSVAEYPTDSIILGPDTGTSHTVYFVLEGVCRMVQNLHIEIKMKSQRKKLLKLHTFFDSKTLNSKSTIQGYASRLFNQKLPLRGVKEVKENGTGSELLDSVKEEEREEVEERTDKPDESNNCGKIKRDDLSETLRRSQTQAEIVTKENPENAEKRSVADIKPISPTELEESKKTPEGSEPKKEFLLEPDHHLKILEECTKRRQEATQVAKKGTVFEKPKNVESFFVQTGFLINGACFGLEKCQKEHFIMSTTKVKCLKIPRRFLFKHNPCYIWNRILLYHSLYLPNDEKILESLRSDRTWLRKKEKLSAEIVASGGRPNSNSITYVPYSVRLTHVK